MIVIWLALAIDTPFMISITPFGWKVLGVAFIAAFTLTLANDIVYRNRKPSP